MVPSTICRIRFFVTSCRSCPPEMQFGPQFFHPAHLQAICNVRVLHLSIVDHGESLFWRPLDPVFAFHNLVELELKNPCDERTYSASFRHGTCRGLFISWVNFGCPVLQDFNLSGCYLTGASELNIHSLSLRRLVLDFENDTRDDDFSPVIVIDAPNLVYFKYFCLMGKICNLRTMESLEKADVTISPEPCVALFQAICKVHVLHLSIIGYDYLLFQRPLDPVLAFHNLVELEFKNYCDEMTLDVAWILEFLRCVPNLKTLFMDFVDANIVSKSLPEEVPTCLLYHLNKIEILYITKDTHMFEMIRYFLSHALVLEKLVMRSIDSPQECRSSIIEKLSSLPKKSKKCKFIVC
ncbi:hypothetical protein V6N13_121861 [Hibiscus sabdariffa]|uniref:FBD domain-containing protein n=2 Tax=Hibiscus sabdariffa TaxID=183260 RepID=A0ABR2C676_9ROSI